MERKFSPERQIWVLADAILRYFDWRERQRAWRESVKIKAMLTRQRNKVMRNRTQQDTQ